MLSGGVSFGRLMYPYFLSALFIALMSLSLNLFVIPSANERRLAFEEQYIKGQKFYNTNRNIHYQIAPGEFVYVESFSTWNNTAYHPGEHRGQSPGLQALGRERGMGQCLRRLAAEELRNP